MIGGDAHMIAIDDGSNNTYAGAGFPVFHAAALDKSGSVKGGPSSEGTYPGSGQYGLVEITDEGGKTISVSWKGKTSKNTVLVAHSFELRVPSEIDLE